MQASPRINCHAATNTILNENHRQLSGDDFPAFFAHGSGRSLNEIYKYINTHSNGGFDGNCDSAALKSSTGTVCAHYMLLSSSAIINELGMCDVR